jgi:hypothetical protein
LNFLLIHLTYCADMVNSRPDRVRIFGGQSGTRTGFPPSTSVFSHHYHPINSPHSYVHLSLKLNNPGNWQLVSLAHFKKWCRRKGYGAVMGHIWWRWKSLLHLMCKISIVLSMFMLFLTDHVVIIHEL